MSALHPEYESNLNAARLFEDLVSDALYTQCGVPIGLYRSKEFQSAHGESRAGFEIKLDRKFRKYNRLFIETAERASDDPNTPLKPSGICSPDNSWIYVIGDHQVFWVFGCQTLRHLRDTGRYENKARKAANGTVTAEGFVLPLLDADKYTEKKIVLQPELEEDAA